MLGLALSSVALTMTGYEHKNKILVIVSRISAIIFIVLFAILLIRMFFVKLQFMGYISEDSPLFKIGTYLKKS